MNPTPTSAAELLNHQLEINPALQGHLCWPWWQDKLCQLWTLLSIRAHFWPQSVFGKPPPGPVPCVAGAPCPVAAGAPPALRALLTLRASPWQGQGRSKLRPLAQQVESWAAELPDRQQETISILKALGNQLPCLLFSAGRELYAAIFFLLSCQQCDVRMPYWCHTWLRSGEDLVQAHIVTGNSVSWFTSYVLSPLSFPLPFMIS